MNDGCEWSPTHDRPAFLTDGHHRTVLATLILGHNGAWRVCESCSKLHKFRHFTVRRQITPAKEANHG